MNENTAATVGQLIDRYEATCLHLLAPQTAYNYRRHLIRLRQLFGDRIAGELKPRDFGPFLSERYGKRGQTQDAKILAVLSAVFTKAVRKWYLLDSNVLKEVEREKNPPRDRLIEDWEFEAVRSSAPLRVQLMMDLALRLGQRQGDLLALKWAQLKDGYVHIQQGKTGKRLAIEITPELKKIFGKCWMLPNRSEYVITNSLGTRYTCQGFRALWQQTMNAHCRRGFERHTFHDIRAMAATKCASIEEASKLLGHANPAITARIYRRGTERVRALELRPTSSFARSGSAAMLASTGLQQSPGHGQGS